MDSELLLWIAAAAAGLTVLSVAFAFGGEQGNSKRMQRVRERARGKGADEKAAEMILRLDQKRQTGFDALLRQYLPRPDLLRQRLQRTGWHIGIGGYAMACVATAVLTLAGMIYFSLPLVASIPGGLFAGLVLPHLAVGFACSRQSKRFTNLFPEAIGLMVRGIKSGLPIGETFVVIGQEVPNPVGNEFRRVSDEIRLGQSMDQALWDAAKRVDTPEIKFLVVSLSVQRETGGNLAETLENLDSILRRRRQMRLKIKAMSSEARASAAIIASLPFIMLAILSAVNPDYIAKLFDTQMGHMMLGAGCFSMALGIFVMQKMARFDI
ncbi:MAG TPA: type II secretion system F family protein [Stellaceae bacterium]|nr:type II secretion system F family protein [Stellaceae bacterium]